MKELRERLSLKDTNQPLNGIDFLLFLHFTTCKVKDENGNLRGLKYT